MFKLITLVLVASQLMYSNVAGSNDISTGDPPTWFNKFKRELEQVKVELKETKVALKEAKVEIKEEKKENSLFRSRLTHMDALVYKNFNRSCQELKLSGITDDGYYDIDPDGAEFGEPGIQVYCNMTTGETEIQNNNNHIEMEFSDDSNHFSAKTTYVAPMSQILTLIQRSEKCSQTIQYDCLSAPIRYSPPEKGDPNYINHYIEWSSAAGDFVDLDKVEPISVEPTQETENNCAVEGFGCNCNKNLPHWARDTGVINYKPDLPVENVISYRSSNSSEGFFTFGALKCSGSSAVYGRIFDMTAEVNDTSNNIVFQTNMTSSFLYLRKDQYLVVSIGGPYIFTLSTNNNNRVRDVSLHHPLWVSPFKYENHEKTLKAGSDSLTFLLYLRPRDELYISGHVSEDCGRRSWGCGKSRIYLLGTYIGEA